MEQERQEMQKLPKFEEELIRPCDCDAIWHRCCIREMIVQTELTACPICQQGYTVGYTDCLALFNKKRPNYMKYMLVQEAIFWFILFTLMFWGYDNARVSHRHGSVVYHTQWMYILTTQFYGNWLLILVLFGLRIRAKYSHREIEDIIVYDVSKRKVNDFDSPAILETYFEELHEYEEVPYYYRKVISDVKKPENNSLKALTSLKRDRLRDPDLMARNILTKYL